MKSTPTLIELDGRTGEGGGQLVRVAVALAAVTSQPIRIIHVRGNRPGPRGGGLKSQHVTSIEWLAEATGADVRGLSVGSHTLEFSPKTPPTSMQDRKVEIRAASGAASTLLIFQAVLPFLLFTANEAGEPVELHISGGTNVSFSLSYEYADQVLLPSLEAHFGISIDRRLDRRGWSMGPQSRGQVWFKIQPLKLGATLIPRTTPAAETADAAAAANDDDADPLTVTHVDASIVTPSDMHGQLQNALVRDLDVLFPGCEVNFRVREESGHDARMYVLLVAHSRSYRWGRDLLFAEKRKGLIRDALGDRISRTVCKKLFEEVSGGAGVVDKYLQDQLVVFQALADGLSSFPRGDTQEDGEADPVAGGLVHALEKLQCGGQGLKKDRVRGPLGEGSLHTTTARWVSSEMLPGVTWYNKGRICRGMGLRIPGASES